MDLFRNLRSLAALGLAALVAVAYAGCSPPLPLQPVLASPVKPPSKPLADAPPEAHKPHSFPEKPITLLVGFSKGTEADLAARTLALRLEEVIGQPVVVVNRVGGDGLEAWSQLKQARADGYTLGQVVSPQLQATVLDPQRKPPFAMTDFLSLANQLLEPGAVFVRPSSPFRTIEELIGAARSQPEALPVSIPAGSIVDRLAAEEFQHKAGVKFRVVEFVDATNARTAALSGQVEAEFGRYAGIVPAVRARQGRFLAFLDDRRLRDWPEVPTVKEKGIDMVSHFSLGYAAPRGMAQDIVDYLAWALYVAIADPGHQAALGEAGLTVRFMGPGQYAGYLAAQGELVSKTSLQGGSRRGD